LRNPIFADRIIEIFFSRKSYSCGKSQKLWKKFFAKSNFRG
jgi:hypothetical protein